MMSRPPKNKTQTSIQSYTHSYFKFISKIPLCKNFVIKSIYFPINICNKLCVFIWYMMNLYYKGIHFILIREGVF